MREKWKWGGVLVLAGGLSAAWATGQPKLDVNVQVEREVRQVDRAGKETVVRQPVGREAKPGDVLVYTLRYRNVGDGPAVAAVLSDPVPPGTVFVPGSLEAAGAQALFSTDGSDFSAWPRVRVARPDGRVEEVQAPAAAIRHIRLALREQVPPGGAGTASFKVIVQ